MSTYKASINAARNRVSLRFGADTIPGSDTDIGTFTHVDGEGGNDTLFHHVRDLLFKKKASDLSAVGFPDGIMDMQSVSIERHGPAIDPATYLTAAAVTAADPATVTAVVKYQPANVSATNTDFDWVSSDPTKATVSSAGVVTGVANGTSNITATHKQNGKSVTFVMTTT